MTFVDVHAISGGAPFEDALRAAVRRITGEREGDPGQDFQTLGVDAFALQQLGEQLSRSFPALRVAGRELESVETPEQLTGLCRGILGAHDQPQAGEGRHV
jgi:hypothetical protein